MKRFALLVLAICLALSAVSPAEVLREIWNGAVSSPYMENAMGRVNSGKPPDHVDILDEPTWADIADNYVARMTGWLTVPETGEYTLYLAGDDYQRLWVSQDDNPANAVEVARVDGWTSSQEWTKYENQRAEPMMLKEGQVLAFVGIMEERGGGDGQDWGWIAPGSEEIVVIPGELFITEREVTALGRAKMNAPADGATGIIDAVLNWGLAVEDAEPPVYNVYFGTDPGALELIAQGIVETSFDVGSVGGELAYATTYYWQVERIGAATNSPRRFTTEPFSFPIESVAAATNGFSGPDAGGIERTVDGSGLDENDGHSADALDMWLAAPFQGEPLTIEYTFDRVYKMDKMLIWNSNTGFESFLGYGIRDVTIEYTLDEAEWMILADLQVARALGVEGNPADTTVDFGGIGAKAVKLTIHSNWGGLFPDTGLSEVRFMYIPTQARFPMPEDGATGVALDTVLGWQAGRDAVSHDVLIGVDELALAGTVEDTHFPLELVYGTTYTWRVDQSDGIEVWEGSIWSFTTRDELADITAPGDLVQGVPDNGNWPASEAPALAIDNDVTTKYLHFNGDFEPDRGPTGFQITPAVGPTIVTALTFTTANDVPGRDPIAFELYGSNESIDGPYTLIASGDIVDFAQDTAWPRFATNETPILFENGTAYAHYQLLFTAIRGPVGGDVDSMQIAEVQLLGPGKIKVKGYVRNALDGEPIASVNDPTVPNVMFFPRGGSGMYHDDLWFYNERPDGYYKIWLDATDYDVNVVADGFELDEPNFEFVLRDDSRRNTARDFLLFPIGVQPPSSPIYRFRVPSDTDDLWYFTQDASEMEDLLYDGYAPETGENDPRDLDNLVYAGIAFSGVEGVSAPDLAVRCFVRENDAKEIPAYAFSKSELEPLDSPNDAWVVHPKLDDVNRAFHAYRSPPGGSIETTAVHRYWSKSGSCYFYTLNRDEPNTWQGEDGPQDWEYRGEAWYVLTQDQLNLP